MIEQARIAPYFTKHIICYSYRHMTEQKNTLSQLGQKTLLPQSPNEAILEAVQNPHQDVNYVTRFSCPEFTSLCPVTGQPDFAHIVIDYVADEFILESKSLKLFMGSFRNHAAFHEDCTIGIAKRIITEIKPKWFRIGGYWFPRGGIPIDIFYQTGEPPKDIWIDGTGVPPYQGR
jgi:7-cyano-7-deazaguanine reductase